MSTDESRWPDLFQEILDASGETDPEAFDPALAEMLILTRQLQRLGQASMPGAEDALARGRERVLQAIPAATPEPVAVRPARIPFWKTWMRGLSPVMAWAPALLMVVLTSVLVLTVTLSVAVGAKPDSPLYPIRRSAEDLAVRLAPPAQREAVLAAIHARRLQDAPFASEQERLAILPKAGQVSPSHPGTTDEDKVREGPDDPLVVAVGKREHTPTMTPSQWVAEVPGENQAARPGSASQPTDTPWLEQAPNQKPTRPAPRKTPSATRSKPRATATPAVRPVRTRPPKATAANRPPRSTPTPTVSRTGTLPPVRRGEATPTPPSRDQGPRVASAPITGVIKRVDRSHARPRWVIIGKTRIYITSKTVIQGKLVRGRRATAWTYVRNRRHYAKRITVKPASSSRVKPATPTPKSTHPRTKSPTPNRPRQGTLPPVRRATPTP